MNMFDRNSFHLATYIVSDGKLQVLVSVMNKSQHIFFYYPFFPSTLSLECVFQEIVYTDRN